MYYEMSRRPAQGISWHVPDRTVEPRSSMGVLCVAKNLTFLQGKTKILIRLFGGTDWFESPLYARANLYGSNNRSKGNLNPHILGMK